MFGVKQPSHLRQSCDQPSIYTSVVSYVVFVVSLLLLVSASFGASRGIYFVIVAFPGYLYL